MVTVSIITCLTFIQLNAHVGSFHFLDNVDQMVVQLDARTSSYTLCKTLSEVLFVHTHKMMSPHSSKATVRP